MKAARPSVFLWLVLAVFPLTTLVAACAMSKVVAPEPVTLEEPESEEKEEAEENDTVDEEPENRPTRGACCSCRSGWSTLN